jgi:hypothetical protein
MYMDLQHMMCPHWCAVRESDAHNSNVINHMGVGGFNL